MNKSSFLIAVLLSLSILTTFPSSGRAQQELGSVAIVAAYADSPETFSFVTLNGVAGGTLISFTDNGWYAAGGFRPNEGVVSYDTPPAGISAGTVITMAGEIGNFNLSGTGDQLFVFEGTILGDGTLDGNLISGFQNNGTSWDADATSSNTSALPATLVGANVAMAAELDNYAYTGPTSGTPAELRAAIYNPANWTGSDTVQPAAPTGFTVVQCYMDMDLDGYGDPAAPVGCGGGAVDNNLDCDDGDPNEFPGQTWYPDCDADTVAADASVVACSLEDANQVSICVDGEVPDGGWQNSQPGPGHSDCDDEDPSEFPGQTWYPDCDADTVAADASVVACSLEDANQSSACLDQQAPDGGWVHIAGLDCDDEDISEFPGQAWYPDCDGDAFYADIFVIACSREEGDQSQICADAQAPDGDWQHTPGLDCNDGDTSMFPGNPEVCDQKDNDCDVEIDEGGICAAGDIVINEIFPNPSGTDIGNEWMELYNNGSSAVDISSWSIETATSSSWSSRYVIPATTTLGPGEFLVIGDEFVAAADLILTSGSLGLGNASVSGDGVRLESGLGTVIDTVIYGPNNNDGLHDDLGEVTVNVAPIGASGSATARVPNGVDTNNSADDFRVQEPTLGQPNVRNPMIFEDGFEDAGPE